MQKFKWNEYSLKLEKYANDVQDNYGNYDHIWNENQVDVLEEDIESGEHTNNNDDNNQQFKDIDNGIDLIHLSIYIYVYIYLCVYVSITIYLSIFY
jgi:hypothetical protein